MHFKGYSSYKKVILRLARGLNDAWKEIITFLYEQFLHTPPASVFSALKNAGQQQIYPHRNLKKSHSE